MSEGYVLAGIVAGVRSLLLTESYRADVVRFSYTQLTCLQLSFAILDGVFVRHVGHISKRQWSLGPSTIYSANSIPFS